jgi:hypothetical protein
LDYFPGFDTQWTEVSELKKVVFLALKTHTAVFWIMIPSTLKMKTACSKTVVTTYQTTVYHNPGHHNFGLLIALINPDW